MTAPKPTTTSLQALLPKHMKVPSRMPRGERLFRHVRRPDWGIGLWVREEPTRRRLYFQDGQRRAFKDGYYHLLQLVDPHEVDIDEVFESIAAEHAIDLDEGAGRRKQVRPVMSLSKQVAVFRELYPGGFRGEAFEHAHRNAERKADRRKRHLGASADDARALLAPDRFEGLDAEGLAALRDDVSAVLRGTAAVPNAQADAVERLQGPGLERWASALGELLHGADEPDARFRSWLLALREVLDGQLEWEQATAPLAFYDPARFPLVCHKQLALQARAVLPRVSLPKQPSARGYRSARQVFEATFKKISEAGLQPRDHLDVFVFTKETLRPKGRQIAASLPGA